MGGQGGQEGRRELAGASRSSREAPVGLMSRVACLGVSVGVEPAVQPSQAFPADLSIPAAQNMDPEGQALYHTPPAKRK